LYALSFVIASSVLLVSQVTTRARVIVLRLVLWKTFGECTNFATLKGHLNTVLSLVWSRDGEYVGICICIRISLPAASVLQMPVQLSVLALIS
jgi:hypothetical protein